MEITEKEYKELLSKIKKLQKTVEEFNDRVYIVEKKIEEREDYEREISWRE